MPGPRRCFATAKALQRLDAVLLCEVLRKFPDYLEARELSLPTDATLGPGEYEAIRGACMAGDIPAELDDVLSYVSILGTTAGWERIQEEARAQKKRLDFAVDGLTHADLAMKAWLWNWPKNKSLLEESYSRARIHARSSYVYFPPMRDTRAKYHAPSDQRLDEMRGELAEYFVAEGLGKGSNVVRFEFEKEIWFLIRFPGRLKRQVIVDDDGETESLTFKPEEYDAVVYHKDYGDLRMNTLRVHDRTKYRVLFGHALLDSSNVFAENKRVISLDPLKGKCLGIFECDDIPGLAEIEPVELAYHRMVETGREVIWRADKKTTLLASNRLAPFLVPEDTDTVRYAIFRYRLKDREQFETLTVHQGNTMTYERDGDSAVLEEWLRSRKFVKDTLAKP
jgi:hypothetical protein